MFADDSNLFFSNCDIPVLFATVNSQLSKISHCFLANKLSLNVTKTKYSFFHKTSKKDDIPLKLAKLQLNNYKIERIPSIKFLGVLLDENLSRKDHIKYNEKKISKNIGILYKARDYLSKESLLSLFYAYINTNVDYVNLFRQDKFSLTKELFVQNKVFNVYQLNILNNLIFMLKVKTETAPAVFLPVSKTSTSIPN